MIDRRMIQLASDPVRRQALVLLSERTAGASEVAEELKISAMNAGRHLDQMHEAGLIEVVGETLSRGVVEPRYRAAVRALWDNEAWEELSLEERKRLTVWILEMIDADTREAVEAGTFTERVSSHASRTISQVDEQGWSELSRIKDDALAAIFAVQAASAERLAEMGEEGIPAMSAMLCCVLPRRAERKS